MGTWGRPRSCHCGECFKCKRADYMREWYRSKSPEERKRMLKQRDRERVREADRQRYHEKRKHDPRYAQQKYASQSLRYALKRGDLQRQPCEVCNAEDAQAHHDDYSKPLDVRWLCTIHHAEQHLRYAA